MLRSRIVVSASNKTRAPPDPITSSMDTFTPRPRTVGRKNNLSLSTKEYAKVCNTSLRPSLSPNRSPSGDRDYRLCSEEQTSTRGRRTDQRTCPAICWITMERCVDATLAAPSALQSFAQNLPSFRRNHSFAHLSIHVSFLEQPLQNRKERPRKSLWIHFPWKCKRR